MFPNIFLCFFIVFATISCSGENIVQENIVYSSNQSSDPVVNTPPESKPGPGPCDPAYVVEYIDSTGHQHLIEIPSICGPETPFQGDPNPFEMLQKSEVSQ